jgi:hypothetical protein
VQQVVQLGLNFANSDQIRKFEILDLQGQVLYFELRRIEGSRGTDGPSTAAPKFTLRPRSINSKR